MSAYGPQQTSARALHMSASGGKAGTPVCIANVAFFVTSFPAGLNITLSPAFNFVTAPDVTSNLFNVSGGVITSLIFDARTDTGVPFTELTLTFPTSRLANFQVDEIDDRVSLGPLIIPPVSEVPLPAALPLFATGLGALGLFEWRRKKKAAALAA